MAERGLSKLLVFVIGIVLMLFLSQRPSLIGTTTVVEKSNVSEAAAVAPKTSEPKAKVASAPATPKPDEKPVAKGPPPVEGKRLSGIDVSHYQGKINWANVKSAGVVFTYVKATEGNSWVDPRHVANDKNARSAGLVVGSYHLFVSQDDPIKQAEHFLSTVKVGTGDLPPALDIEPIAHGLGIDDIPQRVKTWLDHVQTATGCRPIIYSGDGNWKAYLSGEEKSYDVWLAQYTKNANPSAAAPDWTIWQHSEKGRVTGIKGTVDLNYYSAQAQKMEVILCK